MALTPDPGDFDSHSPTWRYLKAFMAGRLASARAELEAEGTTAPQADVLRGRIAELKALIAIDEPVPEISSGAGDYIA